MSIYMFELSPFSYVKTNTFNNTNTSGVRIVDLLSYLAQNMPNVPSYSYFLL